MTEDHEHEQHEPEVADVPEPDQDPDTDAENDDAENDDAEAATGVEDDESPEGADPTDPGVAPVGARDDREIEAAAKKLKKHAETNANRIGAIMGEDAQYLEPCPRCMGGDPAIPKTPGFVWPVNMVPLIPEHKAAVKLSIGEGVEREYKAAQDASRCTDCDGLGKVDSGSQVPGQRHLTCQRCKGVGWIGSRSPASLPQAQNGVAESVPVLATGDDEGPQADPWGRLPGDPMYGVLPGFER